MRLGRHVQRAEQLAFADAVTDAGIHLLDDGHFLLESAGDVVAALVRDFLGRVHGASDARRTYGRRSL